MCFYFDAHLKGTNSKGHRVLIHILCSLCINREWKYPLKPYILLSSYLQLSKVTDTKYIIFYTKKYWTPRGVYFNFCIWTSNCHVGNQMITLGVNIHQIYPWIACKAPNFTQTVQLEYAEINWDFFFFSFLKVFSKVWPLKFSTYNEHQNRNTIFSCNMDVQGVFKVLLIVILVRQNLICHFSP